MFTPTIDLYMTFKFDKCNFRKTIMCRYSMIRESILNNQVTIHWLTTTEQIANVLAKDGVSLEILLKHSNTNKLPTYNQI